MPFLKIPRGPIHPCSPLIEEAALVAALHGGRISATLDMFDQEFLLAHHPFRHSQDTMLTLHFGCGTTEMYRDVHVQGIEDVFASSDDAPIRVLHVEQGGR
jgi:phosphoglycerate dehydrogenase-like enzyme